MRDSLRTIGLYAGIMAVLLGGARGCDMVCNNRTLNKPAYHTKSYATGFTGHIEFTRYSNGSMDVKKYPGLGHRFFSSELHQDFNGDGLVDRIRRNGPEWKMHRLSELLVRENDYQANKERFDEADAQLQDLMEKYPPPK